MEKIIQSLKDDMIATLAKWIKIPSVEDSAAPGAPFGPEVRRSLDVALADAEAMGFSVRNFDGYAGDVRMGPEGVNPLAILAHLDVVPVGEGWTMDPFGAEIRDGRMYGRGTSDDKGPAVAALYAMLAVKKAGIPLKREVRLILGCNEESGWGCMDHYKKVCDMPRSGFSPDAEFPVINTEKGILHISLHGDYCKTGLQVKEFNVGERPNVIPGNAAAIVYGDATVVEKANACATKLNMPVTAEVCGEGLVKLTSAGISGHAAFPEGGRNAIGQLLLVLREMGVEGALKTLADRVGMEYNGSSLDAACSDEISGALTCNLGIIRYDQVNGFYATLDIRYPMLANHTALEAGIIAALAPTIKVVVDSNKDPHHVSPHSPLVRCLLEAYSEVTGEAGKCVSIGGGTYARVLEEGVAFGSLFPGEEELAHQANEYISLDSLMKNIGIFVKAIEKLQDAE